MHQKSGWAALAALLILGLLLSACSRPAAQALGQAGAADTTPAVGGPGPGRGMMGRGMASSGHAPGGLVPVARDGQPLATDIKNGLSENTASQKVGGMNVALSLSPYPPVAFQAGNFVVTLTDDKGQAIPDASVLLDLTMPSMPMPQNKFEAPYASDGHYQATGRFTMRDWWRIEVIVQRGSDKVSAFFDVWI